MNIGWFANNVSFKIIGGSFKDEALKVNYPHTTFKLVFCHYKQIQNVLLGFEYL